MGHHQGFTPVRQGGHLGAELRGAGLDLVVLLLFPGHQISSMAEKSWSGQAMRRSAQAEPTSQAKA